MLIQERIASCWLKDQVRCSSSWSIANHLLHFSLYKNSFCVWKGFLPKSDMVNLTTYEFISRLSKLHSCNSFYELKNLCQNWNFKNRSTSISQYLKWNWSQKSDSNYDTYFLESYYSIIFLLDSLHFDKIYGNHVANYLIVELCKRWWSQYDWCDIFQTLLAQN